MTALALSTTQERIRLNTHMADINWHDSSLKRHLRCNGKHKTKRKCSWPDCRAVEIRVKNIESVIRRLKVDSRNSAIFHNTHNFFLKCAHIHRKDSRTISLCCCSLLVQSYDGSENSPWFLLYVAPCQSYSIKLWTLPGIVCTYLLLHTIVYAGLIMFVCV